MTITTLPAINITEETKNSLHQQVVEEGQVIVHVSYHCRYGGGAIRIWPTTFLLPVESGEKSKLILAENIPMAPQWVVLFKRGIYRFTLVFSPLPKGCKVFHLWEDIPEPNGFLIRNIRRNDSDVYEVKLN